MAQRPVWRGHLRLALVSCPVALYNARHDRSSIRFNLINPDTGNRIRMVTQDAETGQELQRRDLVKGYEFKKNQYLILSDEDLDSVKVESSSVINVEKFVEAGSVDPIYYDAAYYLAPDGKVGEDVYAVLRDAVASTDKIALARVVIAQRERTIALRPTGSGLIAHTLYEERDINSAKDLFEDAPARTDPELVALARQLVERQAARYDPADLEDRYETRLRELIEAKLKGEGIEVEQAEPSDRGNVVDLMAALKRSLGQSSKPEPVAAARSKAASGKAPSGGEAHRQPHLKLPIKGGKEKAAERAAEQAPAASKAPRKRA
ncbi:MAG: Ku protein [Acidisphaera sp.]|nr:Ku protein [Acidisphaera sp.]MBV9813022.1 Ku protein [Acetobacteraceae bacterium]